MLIALLAVSGVDLIVILVLLAGVISHRRWISSRAGAFRGPIPVGRRTAAGDDVKGLGASDEQRAIRAATDARLDLSTTATDRR